MVELVAVACEIGVLLVAVRRGPVERAVRHDVRALGDLDGVQRALAETAYTLAYTLDSRSGGGPDMATAAVARELRVTLQAIVETADDDAAGAELEARLSAAVGDTTPSRPADARPKGRGGRGAAGNPADALAAARRRRGARGGP